MVSLFTHHHNHHHCHGSHLSSSTYYSPPWTPTNLSAGGFVQSCFSTVACLFLTSLHWDIWRRSIKEPLHWANFLCIFSQTTISAGVILIFPWFSDMTRIFESYNRFHWRVTVLCIISNNKKWVKTMPVEIMVWLKTHRNMPCVMAPKEQPFFLVYVGKWIVHIPGRIKICCKGKATFSTANTRSSFPCIFSCSSFFQCRLEWLCPWCPFF